MELEGKVAIVTGASRGVGAATAIALAAEGVAVACAARATDERPLALPGTIDATVRAILGNGGRAVAVATNLGDDADIVRMVEAAHAAFGRIDILVNNAAITFPGDIAIAPKRFDLVFDIDVRAPFRAVQEVLPHLRAAGGGAILNVSSVAALNYFPSLMAYGMAKSALEHMTMCLAAQLRTDGIAVNTFRIDVPVASEGFVANAPGLDHSQWEPPSVAAEGIVWMLQRPPSYTGRHEGMAALAAREGIMATRTGRPPGRPPGITTETHLLPPA